MRQFTHAHELNKQFVPGLLATLLKLTMHDIEAYIYSSITTFKAFSIRSEPSDIHNIVVTAFMQSHTCAVGHRTHTFLINLFMI